MKAKRPVSVWIVLILLGFTDLYLLGLTKAFIYFYASGHSRVSGPAAFVIGALIRIGLVVLIGWTVFAVARGRNAGRIIALVLLVSLCGFFLYASAHPPKHPVAGMRPYKYKNAAEQGGANIMDIMVFAGFTVLFFRFGFSQRSRRFFATHKGETVVASGTGKNAAAAGE
jgi:hypothetical protein